MLLINSSIKILTVYDYVSYLYLLIIILTLSTIKGQGEKVMNNFRSSKSKFIIITTCDDDVVTLDMKPKEKQRGWGRRKINGQKAPCGLGEPLASIREKTLNGLRFQRLYQLNKLFC